MIGGSLLLAGLETSSCAGNQLLNRRRCRQTVPPARGPARQRRCYVCASTDDTGQKRLTILHFNDVYNIEQRGVEPVGGAARFAHAVRQHAVEQPLVLFSGDCLNPSLMSAFTRGEQMVPVLNHIGVHAAAVGNHDFDFGVPTLQHHMKSFRFPWLLSNVLDARTGQPLGGAHSSRIVEWQGVRVGLMGLVEREWLLTIPSVEESDIAFLDFCAEGRRLAGQLRAQGADLVVALTHMRTPNDLVLAAEVPEIQLVLGGHDHHYEVSEVAPHGTHVFKSGTDFREFSVIRLQLPASPEERPRLRYQRVEINSAVPEDAEMAAIVKRYQDLIGTKMDEPMGWAHTDLDARFDTVRTAESNLGSLFADVMRISLGADAAFFNGGTIRSDQVHAAGQLLMRDFVSMLPFTDDLVLLELSGADLLRVLETGVGAVPALEGRFLQVSGIRFEFDAGQQAGRRIVPGSVEVAGAPLDPLRMYKVATKAYLRGGKDGFESLKASRVLVDGETNPRLATLVQYLWMRVEQLNETLAEEWQRMVQREQRRAAGEASDSEAGEVAERANGSGSSSGSAGAREEHGMQVAVGSSGAGAVERAAGATVTYSPGSPLSGVATGLPGSIPTAAEQHVHEVSSTGAAISLALLLEQRRGLRVDSAAGAAAGFEAAGAAAGFKAAGGRQAGGWVSLLNEEQQACSSAALSALAYLEPCAHGLDELIVFDPIKRKFGIAPQVEGRIRCVSQHTGGA